MFIMSLAAADITVGGIVMPISSVYAITGQWVFGLAVCQFWLSADYTASTASILNLFILSMDRYWSITSPLRYLRRRTKKRAIIMIGLVWIGSALWILPIIGWHYIESGGKRMYPPTVCETEFASNVAFKVTAACLNFYIPTLLMVYLYGRIYFEIKKRSRFDLGQCNHSNRIEIGPGVVWGTDSLVDEQPPNLLRSKSKPFRKKNVIVGETHQFRNLTVLSYKSEGTQSEGFVHFEGVTVNVEYVELTTTTMDAKYKDGNHIRENSAGSQYRRTFAHKNTTKRRNNDSDSVTLQKEKKAARQLGVIMAAFVLCWLPYFVLFTVIAFCSDCVNPLVHTATIWLGYINSTFNPILYPLCNTNFKRAFKKMLGFGGKDRNVLMTMASRGGYRQPN
ncbi:histamine H1 receptor isoform X2 [Cryptotermes secundus]|nr:histamine H1 receptor isoform X2 [Cryptotermes secundus]XP_033610756.1 histamine H1 receptor isoform X2 [Cryptotermes secundus]